MPRGNIERIIFNRGRISRLGLARTDLDRTAVSADLQTNMVPRVLGSMMLRPGLEYVGGTRSNSSARLIPFIFDNNDTALIELTGGNMRIWVDEAIVTRSGVSSTFTNGAFTSDLTGWTDADDSGSTSYWVTGSYLGLQGTRYASARRRQTVTVASTDANTEHGIRVVIDRGRVDLRMGSSTGGGDYLSPVTLRPGTYDFSISPSSNIYVQVESNTGYTSRVTSFSVDSSGNLVIPTTWNSTDLELIRTDPSGDVTFVACKDLPQRRIERYATRSWGIAAYEPEDGPYRIINTGNSRLAPSDLSGDITLSADGDVFDSSHVGALFKITSAGQEVSINLTGENQFSDAIRVTGVDEGRNFQILITQHGATDGTIKVQRSIGSSDSFANVSGLSYTSTIDSTHDDTLDNQIVYYRIGMNTGDYTGDSSTSIATLIFPGGGITGVARINSVSGATESSASVITNFGSTESSELWSEGEWSGFRGYPTAVRFHEGRLFWAGKGSVWGSISDAYESFDEDDDSNAGPLNRSIGTGAVDHIPWMVSLGRLIIGAESREIQVKTDSLEAPVTPTNFSLRDVSDHGSTQVQAIKIDKRALFVQRGGTRVYEVGYTGDSLDFETAERSVLIPEIGEPGIVQMGVQRQPDTRVHCIRSDGTVGMLISEPVENVVGWLDITSTGANGCIEDIAVLPGAEEDKVYYVVKREVNGSTVRYIERWAKESEARGDSTNKIADSLGTFNSTAATTAVTGADHLVGETVVCWGGTGVDLGTATVSSTGSFDVATASTTVYYGLGYDGWYKSGKLGYGDKMGTSLTQKKRVNHVGLILADAHAQSLHIGETTSTADLRGLPRVENAATVSTDKVHSEYDEQGIPVPGRWTTDSRIVLRAQAPHPVTVLGAIVSIDMNEKA